MSASTRHSTTPPLAKRSERNETTVGSVGQEAPIAKMKTSCETAVKADEPEEEGFEDNPYGLKDDAQKWLEDEMKPFGAEGYLVSKTCYRPHLIDSNSSISDETLKKKVEKHLYEKAGAEYGKRVKKAENKTIKKPIQPVLVLLGVSKKMMDMFNEQEALGRGHQFLYFPSLNWKGKYKGALFITYMRGPKHAVTDTAFLGEVSISARDNGLIGHLVFTGRTGVYGKPQPDLRIYPFCRNKDNQGNDQDPNHYMTPHSRLYWEVEYQNLNIIDPREHGKKLMDFSEYTRLFACCKFTGTTQENPTFEAALVLWGKNDNNEIEVLKAIDFGSRELVPKSKQDWSKSCVNMLPAVPVTMWNRPGNAGARPWLLEDFIDPVPEWVLRIPIKSLLYKVTADGSDEYLTSQWTQRGDCYYLNGRELTDMDINLKIIARKIANEVEDRAQRTRS